MDDQLLAVALARAAEALGFNERVWLYGMAHLVDLPVESEPTDDHFVRVIDAAQAESDFPSGPVAYIPSGFTQEVEPEFRMVSLRPAAAPHLEMKLGLGVAGFVAVGLTRSDMFEDGASRPAAVLLSDFESVISDTYALTVATATEASYTGPVELAFTILRGEALAPSTLYSLDPETGEYVVENSGLHRFEPLTARFELTEPLTGGASPEVTTSLDKVARKLARRFNQSRPQLLGS